MGRLLGARHFVQGGCLPWVDAGSMQLIGVVTNVVTLAENSPSQPLLQGAITQALQVERALLFQLLPALGVRDLARVRARLRGLPKPKAFLEFSGGTYLETRSREGGLTTEQQKAYRQDALTAFRRATELDPSFELAQHEAELLSIEPSDFGTLDQEMIGAMPESGDPQQRSTDALGFGPTTGTQWSPSATARVDDPTRIGASTNQPLPGFPGPPKRTPAMGGPR